MTMYAWSRIVYGAERDDDGNILGPLAVEVNEAVDQEAVGADDDQWQVWVDDGVIRETRMPDALQDANASPRQLMQNMLTEAQEGFNMSGPTEDLLRRFDDEGAIVPTEETQEIAFTTPASQPDASSDN
jgi:hypothetical protein